MTQSGMLYQSPVEVTDLDLAFPARGPELTPAYEVLPTPFVTALPDNLWRNLFNDVFRNIAEDVELIPKYGVDADLAWRHLRVVMGTYGTKHEHKEAGWVWLASLWFEAARWKHRGMEYQVGVWPTRD